MPGDRHIRLNDPFIIELFHHALRVQAVWIIALGVVILSVTLAFGARTSAVSSLEPRQRSLLRGWFGMLWVIDGLLQLQPSMPVGLGSAVIAPTADGTPWWLHHLVISAVNTWGMHPIALASAAAWLEIGLGAVLIASRGRGRLSRIAAGVMLIWSLVIWVGGTALGGMFSTGASILFGWPGATPFYAIAAVWLLLPDSVFPATFSRVTLRVMSVIFALAIIEQAWPDHGFWHGGANNALTAMTNTMTRAAQPQWFATTVNHAGRLGSIMGGGLNLVVIFWLIASAIGMWRMSTRDVRWPLWVVLPGCGLIWIVAQDAAIFGGLSTDLNSMVPIAMLVLFASPRWRDAETVKPWLPEAANRGINMAVGSLGVAMMVVAIVPMVRAPFAQAETTLYRAQNGDISVLAPTPAPRFSLVNQYLGRTDFPPTGRFGVVTFLDPTCWTDCPLLAAQLKSLDAMLTPAQRRRVVFVAVAGDPYHERISDLRHFIAKNRLGTMGNFRFVTGPLSALEKVWTQYGIQVSMRRTDRMSVHTDVVYVVNPEGNIRVIVPDDPVSSGAGTASSAVVLYNALARAGLR